MNLIVLGIAATGCTSIGFLAGAAWTALPRLDAGKQPIDGAGRRDGHRTHIHAVRASNKDVLTRILTSGGA